ncbi:hypothetical protein C0995_009564 [Termitomyces sp. Mi166|nr:hypothetical protein C0995_009564 [Termitomyces sp. Mi166\
MTRVLAAVLNQCERETLRRKRDLVFDVAKSVALDYRLRQDTQPQMNPVAAKARLSKQFHSRKALNPNEVIEISSDEEDNSSGMGSRTLYDFFLPISGSWPTSQKSSVNAKGPAAHESQLVPSSFQTIATPRKLYRASRRVIESSGSEDSDVEGNITHDSGVIELSDNSPKGLVQKEAERPSRKVTARTPISSEDELFDTDRENDLHNDDSVLILDEPRSARKPLRLPDLSKASSPDLTDNSEQSPTLDRDTGNPKGTCRPKALDAPLTPATPMFTARTPGSRNKGTPRLSKKAQAAVEQERRVIYAQELFDDLNRSVFEGRLPKETKLNWSKRLLTTAGRAKWHRSRDGVQTTEIELAEKILDCDECLQCSKIYGRHSKSIDVTKVVCGACKEGRLIALFETRASRNLKTPKTSKLGAAKPQDSPRSLPQIPANVPTPSNTSTNRVIYVIHDSDSERDAEIETLATAMGSVTFG